MTRSCERPACSYVSSFQYRQEDLDKLESKIGPAEYYLMTLKNDILQIGPIREALM